MPDPCTLESIREHPDMEGYRRKLAEMMAAPDVGEREFMELADAPAQQYRRASAQARLEEESNE